MDKIKLTKLHPKPYQTIRSKPFHNTEIEIRSDLFSNTKLREGEFTFNFENCVFKNKTIINNPEKIGFSVVLISFSFCIIESLELKKIIDKNINLHFHSCILNGVLSSKTINHVSLNNCITSQVFFTNLPSLHISYTQENIFLKKWLLLLDVFFHLRKELKRPKVTDQSLKTKQKIDILLNTKQSIHINLVKNVSVYFNHENAEPYKPKYYLSREQKNLLNINLNFYFSHHNADESVEIRDGILNSLSLKGEAQGGVSIERTKINNFFIRNFSAKQDVLFYNISPSNKKSNFEIYKSNLDNTWFDNIDFDAYQQLSFFRTKFAKASFTSCNFPKDSLSFEKFKALENIHEQDKKSQNYYKDQYETFLQLKEALENTGNIYEAQKLNAISKDALMKVSGLPFWDKIILKINSLSNNHNLSIARPLCCIFTFSIIFYILYLNSIGQFYISSKPDYSLISHYFIFLDLTHSKSFLIPKSELPPWALVIDFFNKIFVGFFVYQFIVAFRKYSKK